MTSGRILEGVPPELGLDRAQACLERGRALVSRGLQVRQQAIAAYGVEPSFGALVAALDKAAEACVQRCADMSAAWEAGQSILPHMDALDVEHARFEAAVGEIEALLFRVAEPATARVQ